jgi:ABC-type transport system involved in multi-copper enzyme maturation permease subunit
MVVAMADLKAAMSVRFVKFGLLGMGAFGPIIAVIMVVSTVAFMPPGPDFDMLIQFMTPMVASFLMIFGIIPATMISANALVGEREQKTLEPLLATPLTDRELLVGKLLSSMIPSAILLFGGTAVSIIAENAIFLFMGLPIMIIPDLGGLVMIFVAGPAMIVAVVSFMILISGRVSRVYEAYQMTSIVVMIAIIPMIVPSFFIGGTEIGSVVFLTYIVTIIIALVMMAVTFTLAIARFNRDRLTSMV